MLSERIAKHDLAERVWVMPGADGSYVPTQMQVEAWNKRLEQVPNSICFSFSLWEGYDGRKEQFVILGKVPWPFIADDYERARMLYNNSFFLQRTAYTLEQGAGRCRRGELKDYNLNGEINTYVAIADGSWHRVQKYLSQSMQEAIGKQ